MTNLITQNFKYNTAKGFIETMTGNSLYLFLGRQIPWANDASPDVPMMSSQICKKIWDNMLGGVLVTQNNMTLIIPNILWNSGQIYAAYSDRIDMSNTANSFYIVNSSNEVYKCISNNQGAISTVSPSGLGSNASNYIQTTSDGYQWKYMLNVSPTDKFLTTSWLPVPIIPPPNSPQSIVTSAAIPGSICAINITSSPVGYANNPISYIVTITGDGINANAYANVVNGQVQNIVMANYGQNYTRATVSIAAIGAPRSPIAAQAQAVISPQGGHGSNAALELNAKTVMIAVQTSDSESGFLTTQNSFRQNGLLLNPFLSGTSNIANATLIQTSTYVNIGGGTGSFINNEMVYQGLATDPAFSGNVIDYNSSPNLLRLNSITGVPQIGNILVGMTSGTQRYITTVQSPTVQTYTGQILAFDNEPPIQRQTGQTELFQFIETFG